MNILNQNLKEGQTIQEEPKIQQSASKVISKPVVKSTSKLQSKTTSIVPQKEEKPRTTIKFAFTMDSFVIDLMTAVNVCILF